MSRFLDGPAAGQELTLARAPIFLRVVIDQTDGKVDALDRLDDTPSPSEHVHVYERVDGTWRSTAGVFACVRSGPHRGCHHSGGESADYRHPWQAWAKSTERARPKAEAFGS